MRMKSVGTLLVLSATVFYTAPGLCHTEGSGAQSAQAPEGVSLLDKFNQVVRDATRAANQGLMTPEPRKINKKELPALILKEDNISFNDKRLRLGEPLNEWLSVLPPAPRCIHFSQRLTSCYWDNLGLTVSVDGLTSKVDRLDIYFQKRYISKTEEMATRLKQLKANPPPSSSEPVGTFGGYFELDGFGIDNITMFWEIEKSIDQSRNLHCGLRDCQFRDARFGENSRIYFRLNGPAATDTISLIQINQE